MATNVKLLKTARQVHLYFGVFIAPALLFFAFTGLVQTFGMHETSRGSSYKPPKILEQLGQLHKKQTLVLPVRKPQAPAQPVQAAPKEASAPQPAPKPTPAITPEQKKLLPMKLFFALVSIGLFTSTLTGVYMAYKFGRNAKLITGLWLAGIILPVLFTLL